jgi:dihydrofolate reductase
MGSVTYDGLPTIAFGQRRIMVVGRSGYPNVTAAIQACGTEVNKIFICGGQRVYEEALSIGMDITAYVTHIVGDYDCDRFISLNYTNENIIHQGDGITIKMTFLLLNCYNESH